MVCPNRRCASSALKPGSARCAAYPSKTLSTPSMNSGHRLAASSSHSTCPYRIDVSTFDIRANVEQAQRKRRQMYGTVARLQAKPGSQVEIAARIEEAHSRKVPGL